MRKEIKNPRSKFVRLPGEASKECRHCKNEVKVFHAMDYMTLTGWCSQECFFNENKAVEEERKNAARNGITLSI